MLYSKKTDRNDFFIDDVKMEVLIQQRWIYEWINYEGYTKWTDADKKNFHSKADAVIWSMWGTYYKLRVRGNSKFAKTNANKVFTVRFDLKKVTSNHHWKVRVTKNPWKMPSTASTNWLFRTIEVTTDDVTPSTFNHNKGQVALAHEFGHSIGGLSFSKNTVNDDEYFPNSAYFDDKNSLMNVGNEMRVRFLDYIITQLNTMIKDCEFY